jgi:hypothetical protein
MSRGDCGAYSRCPSPEAREVFQELRFFMLPGTAKDAVSVFAQRKPSGGRGNPPWGYRISHSQPGKHSHTPIFLPSRGLGVHPLLG